jgi:hypothetical protein
MPVTVMAAEDAAEHTDHPLLKRYEGAVILQHDHKAFDEYTVPLGKEAPDANIGKNSLLSPHVGKWGSKSP